MSSQSTLQLLQSVSITDATRDILDITPLATQTITQNANFLQLVLPNMEDAFAVGPDLTLNFDLTLGTTGSVVWDSRSPWSDFKIKIDGRELVYEREFGHRGTLDNFLTISDPSYRDNSYAQLLGSNQFTATSSTYTRRVQMRFPKHCFLDQLIPLFGNKRIEIQLYANQTIAEFIDAVTTESSFQIDNISLRTPVLTSNTLANHYRSAPVRVAIDSYDHYRDMSISSGNTTATIPITISQKNVSGILAVMRNQADVNDADLGQNKYTGSNLTNALSRLQLKINNKLWPDRPIICDDYNEPYEYLLEYCRMRKDNKELVPCSLTHAVYAAATAGCFCIAIALDSLTGSASTINGGANLTQGANQIQLLLNSMVASANTQMDIFVRYSRVCTWTQGKPTLD